MKFDNDTGLLEVDKDELIGIIENNPDQKNSWEMDQRVIDIIKRDFNKLTDKQEKWILKKVNYIFRKLKRGNVKKFKFVGITPKSFLIKKTS